MIEWLICRFRYAFRGIRYGISRDKSIRLQFISALVICTISLLFRISPMEWVIILLCIGFVLTAEMLNSAIENCVDYISADYHEIAARIKDLAAGAVCISSIISAIIGLIIFFPYIKKLFETFF